MKSAGDAADRLLVAAMRLYVLRTRRLLIATK